MYKLLLPVLFVSVLIGCGPKSTSEESTATESSTPAPAPGPPLPVFNLKGLDGKDFSTATLPDDMIFIFFNPGCDHCQQEATAINGRKKEFEQHQVYFVSVDSLHVISKFQKDYDLTDANFHFAAGDVETIVTAMGPVPSVPCIYIYRNRNLVSRLEGVTEIDEILRLAEGRN
ncbi:MAG: redoxin domain-containing protein [Bacteroidota bacterium]